MTLVRSGCAAVLAALLLLPAAPAAAAAPDAITGATSQASVPAQASLGTIASLSVGSGTWTATATFTIDHRDELFRPLITCRLVSSDGSPAQTGSATYYEGDGANGAQDMDLTAAGSFDRAGTFALRCRSSQPGVVARRIRITALKVGAVQLVTKPSGDSALLGSGAANVIQASRTDPVSLDYKQRRTLITQTLPNGRWWVHASLTMKVRDLILPDVTTCRVSVGAESEQVGILLDADTSMVAIDGTGVISDRLRSPTVRLSCLEIGAADGQIEVSDVRLTAIRLGSLSMTTLPGGTATMYGTGSPVALAYSRPTRILIPDTTVADWTQVARSADLHPGAYLVRAVMQHGIGPTGDGTSTIRCRLSLGTTTDLDPHHYPGLDYTASQSVAAVITETDAARLACGQPRGPVGPLAVEATHLLVVRLGSLTTKTLD